MVTYVDPDRLLKLKKLVHLLKKTKLSQVHVDYAKTILRKSKELMDFTDYKALRQNLKVLNSNILKLIQN